MRNSKNSDHIILPKTHPSMYLMHKYWARKPYNVVSEYIKKYTTKGSIVLDPFCGSGVTIAESILLGRKAIGMDINPFAVFLTKNTIIDIDQDGISKIFNYLKEIVADECLNYYSTVCPFCKSQAVITQLIWNNVNSKNKEPPKEIIQEIRLKCDVCNLSNEIIPRNDYPDFYEHELERINHINYNFQRILKEKQLNFPNINFQYKNGEKFRQIRHYLIEKPAQEELFTKRNLIVLSLLKKGIDNLTLKDFVDKNNSAVNSNIVDQFLEIKDLLKITFTANLGQSSKMVWVISKRKGKTLDKKEVGSWTHHFFWNPTEFFEINPWISYCTRFNKTQRAKKNFHDRLADYGITKRICISEDMDEASNKEWDVILLNQGAQHIPIESDSIDYIFTDPPYGDSVQYLELSTLWNGWLGFRYNNSTENEIVINSKQEKNLDTYSKMLEEVFKECFRVLKVDRYMTITFHNTDIKVRNSVIESANNAGFLLEGLVFQMPPRNSLKSYLHYDNSPVGDYFLRFKKITNCKAARNEKTISHDELLKLLKDRIRYILKERGQPTPSILLFNMIDEFLVENGYFPLKQPELVQKILDQLKEDQKFIFNEKNSKWDINYHGNPKVEKISLNTKIRDFLRKNITDAKNSEEKSETSQFNTYSDFYNLVYQNFNGIYTPDRKEVMKIFEQEGINLG